MTPSHASANTGTIKELLSPIFLVFDTIGPTIHLSVPSSGAEVQYWMVWAVEPVTLLVAEGTWGLLALVPSAEFQWALKDKNLMRAGAGLRAQLWWDWFAFELNAGGLGGQEGGGGFIGGGPVAGSPFANIGLIYRYTAIGGEDHHAVFLDVLLPIEVDLTD